MKILFVCENYYPHIGGAEIVFKTLAEGLVKAGHQVSIVTHQLKHTNKREIISGVKIYRIHCFESRYWFTFLSLSKVLRLAKKADIIHTTTFNGAPPAWLAAKIRNKPCLLTVHEVWINQWKNITEMHGLSAGLHDFLERIFYRLKFTRYAAVSHSTQKQLLKLGISPALVNVIYNGVDYEHWDQQKYNREKIRQKLQLQKNFVYLFHGRPGTSKGLEYLIKAVPLISKLIPQSKLVAIVSRDPAYQKNYQQIVRLIKKLKIEDKIRLLPPVNYRELPDYIQAADCVVVPSLSEGFGFSVTEACAMNIPVVASNTTSIPEVISGKYVLVPPKDPRALAEGVFAVYQKKYQQKPKKLFKIDENIDGYINEYETMLKNYKS